MASILLLTRTSKATCVDTVKTLRLDSSQKPSFQVGRLPTCDLTLISKKLKNFISRAHAELVYNSDMACWQVVDRGSVNGVLVNGRKIKSAELAVGDVIVFGQILLDQVSVGTKVTVKPTNEFVFTVTSITNPQNELKRKRSQEREDMLLKKVKAMAAQNEELQHLVANSKQAQEETKKEVEGSLEALKERNRQQQMIVEEERQARLLALQQLEQTQQEAKAEAAKVKELAEEQERLREQNEKEREKLSREREEEIEKMRTKLQNQTKGEKASMVNKLIAECTCPICMCLFLQSTTTACGHTFCKLCLEGVLRVQERCPSCRQLLTQIPQPSVVIENTVGGLIANTADAAEAEEMEERRAERQAFDRKCAKRLKTITKKVADAKRDGLGFILLTAHSKWSADDLEIFRSGMEHSRNTIETRRVWGTLVGLNEDWIKVTPIANVKHACTKLKMVDIPRDPQQLRDRLWRYLTFGCTEYLPPL